MRKYTKALIFIFLFTIACDSKDSVGNEREIFLSSMQGSNGSRLVEVAGVELKLYSHFQVGEQAIGSVPRFWIGPSSHIEGGRIGAQLYSDPMGKKWRGFVVGTKNDELIFYYDSTATQFSGLEYFKENGFVFLVDLSSDPVNCQQFVNEAELAEAVSKLNW